ncbi:tetratricopeptide repeat protein [Thalassotalea ponticola]|uniref:tetratricopeptide repeat protein n=1 Tax=Thalassotalea ponticola TaxID=1523392 RepID=UPI0025B486F4|nr:tetratricopeptide repeat protein [Thalassotalea ponticola]MDN3653253.1 tetratricopeptide repeat protein [Thalassotalea ponticola]
MSDTTPKNEKNSAAEFHTVIDQATLQSLHQGFCLNHVIVEPDEGLIIRDGTRYHLAPKAMEILVFLASQQCQVVSRQAILNFGWGEGGSSYANVTHVISEIRHALGDHKECPRFIQTIPRKGYRMMVASEEKPMSSFFKLTDDAVEPLQAKRKWSLTLSIFKSSRLFKASVAYVIFSWVMLQVLSVVLPIFHAPNWVLILSTLLLIVCFPLLISFQWFKELRKRRRNRIDERQRSKFFYQQLAVDSVFVSLVLVVIYFVSSYLMERIEEEQSGQLDTVKNSVIEQPVTANAIAVMPFTVNSQQADTNQYLVNQLQEEIINVIGINPHYQVASLRATAGIDSNASIDDIKRRLGVHYIVEGVAYFSGNSVRINTQIIDTVSGFQVWNEHIDSPRDSALELYQELSRKLISALQLLLPNSASNQVSAEISTNNVDAFDAYLQGKEKLRNSKSITSLNDAITFFKQAIQYDPNFVDASAMLCQTHMEAYLLSSLTSHYESGVRVCNITANVTRINVNTYVSLAKLYFTEGRLLQAQQQIDKALAINANAIPVLLTQAQVLEKQKQIDEADLIFNKVISLEPTFWQNYYDYGRFLYNQGQYQQAIEQFNKATLLKEDVAIVHNALGGAYFLLMDWEKASVSWSKAMAIEPTAMLYSNLATSLFFNKQFDDAATTYLKSLELSPDDDLLWGNLGDAYKYSSAQQHKATESYETALLLAKKKEMINPNDLFLQSRISRYHSELGNCKAADSYRQNVLRQTISDPYIYYQLAILALNCNDKISAEQHLLSAIELGYAKPLILADPQFMTYKEQLSNVFN